MKPKTAEHNVVVTCEMKLFQNYFSLFRHPPEMISFQRSETRLKLFQKLIAGRDYFPTMFKVAEIIVKRFQWLK